MVNRQHYLKILTSGKTLTWLWCLHVVLISDLAVLGQKKDLQYYYREGSAACQEGRYQDCLINFTTANQLRPNHQIIMYHQKTMVHACLFVNLSKQYTIFKKFEKKTIHVIQQTNAFQTEISTSTGKHTHIPLIYILLDESYSSMYIPVLFFVTFVIQT